MAEILLFHHALGLTPGLQGFAERLRASGHTVHAPDAYAGVTFEEIDDGVAHAETIGHDALLDAARHAAWKHPATDVTMGFSLGTGAAQVLAQNLRRVRGCVLMGGACRPTVLGGDWRHECVVDIHVADPDEWVSRDEVEGLMYQAPHSRLFEYAGKGHMFMDPSSSDYDGDAADDFEDRVMEFLVALDAGLEPRPMGAERHPRSQGVDVG